MDQNYVEASLFEHRFWLQILGDHARFIFDSLSPKEENYIKKAHYYIKAYDQLLNEARKPLSINELESINNQAVELTNAFKEFKFDIQRRLLVGKMSTSLPPTLVNHMINELEEYQKVLVYIVNNQTPVIENPIAYHLMWVLDTMGHADQLIRFLDATEKNLIEKRNYFSKQFCDYYYKTVEIAGYMRTGLKVFPALSKFNKQIEYEVELFNRYVNDLKHMASENQLLGPLPVLLTDHYLREHCYYLTKLAMATKTELPKCDATRPRVKS